jgi:hypothetical protein
MSNAIMITILVITTLSALLSGVAVFTNIAPEPAKPDPRIGEMQEALIAFEEDIHKTLEEMQKALLLMEHRMGKDAIERQREFKGQMDVHIEALLKAISDISEGDEL